MEKLGPAGPGLVDQFEEDFTLSRDPDERAAFITLLITATAAATSRTRVVLGPTSSQERRPGQ
ncbi:nSTAND1 domain-containing NTPase [Streptomyces xanthophaeus]|uniref:nSTAND1 domain-containing NTPase n=1 Tax=Streptomyces xanthophaeus TaxID=67385 RepID=UPI003571372C